MWAEPVAGGDYQLRNVPFFAYGLSFEDTVQVRKAGEQLLIRKVRSRSGHSTYRIFVKDDADFEKAWGGLESLGCSYERATEHLYAVDVPAGASIYAVFAALEGGKRHGAWDFEEGHCGHPTR